MAVLPIRSGELPVRIFRFGPFILDVRAGELRKRGVKIRLPDQSLQVLLMLLDRPGDVVLREEIREKLWPDDTIVEFDPSINAAIKKLREALGDSADEPRYVETLARRGYRFLGEVEKVGEPGAEAAAEPSTPAEAAAPTGKAVYFRGALEKLGVAWIAAGVLAIALAALAIVHFRETAPEAAAVRFAISPPEGTSLGGPLQWPQMAVSPDGRRLAFVAYSGVKRQLWVRPLDTTVAQPLAGTEGANMPFWSPDSRSLGFLANRQLKKIDANGGPAITLCDATGNFAPGTWTKSGVILFSKQVGQVLRVPDSGGTATPATKLDESTKEATNRFPWFLPDGRHFLYAASAQSQVPSRLTIRVGSLDSPESKVLLDADSNAVYSQGHLLYLRDENTLMAQPFDPRRLVTIGDAVPVAQQVRRDPYKSLGILSVSENGVLAYQVGTGLGNNQLSWLDRSGNNLGSFGDPASFGHINLSPDGKRLGMAVYDSNTTEIWLYDVARGVRSRFAPGPGRRQSPVWSPDGRTIVFTSQRNGAFDLYRKPSDGSGAEELLYADGRYKDPTSWSPDGKFLIYDTAENGGANLWLLPLTPEQPGAPVKPIPLQQGGGDGQFSPDGRWVAYRSAESGTGEIYAAAFRGNQPLSGKKWQVSTAGGAQPRWGRDGKEIFFVALDNKVMAAEVSFKGDAVEIGKARELFGPVLHAFGYQYEVAADGQRFLAAVPSTQPAPEPLTMVVNWTAGLKK